jgi:Tfp pilus assembly protein PilF
MLKRSTNTKLLVVLLTLMTVACASTHDPKPAPARAKVSVDSAASHQQAVTLMQQEKWQQAVILLETLTTQHDNLSGPWLNLGIAYTKTGNSESAEAAFRKSIDMNTTNSEAYNQLGILYRRTGRLIEAGFIYETALKFDPGNASIHWNLGILHDKYLPNPRKALLHYQRYQQIPESDDPQLQAWINTLIKDTQKNSLTAKVNQ